ncbi:MAG: thiamine diphosphokinase [Nitriliruptoraceae bacterium]
MDASTTRHDVVVLAGGDIVTAAIASRLPTPAWTIAADSGLHQATVLGLDVTHVVGDLDSVDAATLAAAVDAGARVDRYPAAKDQTDLEIALDTARSLTPARIFVVGGHGGRLDHFLANFAVIAAAARDNCSVVAYCGTALITVVTREATLTGRPGALVSLLPIGGPARQVSTRGLGFPLDSEDLLPGASRGVSNTFVGTTAEVTVAAGTLLAIQPDELSTNADPRM